jgi:hypothetical protein
MNEIVWKYDEPLTDENLITEFETKSGFTFPPSYRSLVIEHNGARPDKKIFNTDSDEGHVFGNLLSFNKADTKNLNIWETNKNMPSDIDSKYIAFATDAFGNWICFNAEDGSIVFIDHDNSSIENVANAFDAFIDGLYGDDKEDSPIKDDDETQQDEDEEATDNTAQSDEGTFNEPTEDETVTESVTPVKKKSIYEDTGIELEEDDLITESFAIENFSKFRDKLYNSESPKCSVTSVNNNSFRIKINNGTAKEYIDVTNEFHGKVSAIAHTLSGNKRVVSSDLMSSAYTKIRKAIIGLFGNFKVVSESYSPIEFGDSSFSRWGTNLIQEADEESLSEDFEVPETSDEEEPKTEETPEDTSDEEVTFDDISLDDDDDDEIFTSGDFDEYKKDDLSDNMSFDEPSSYIDSDSIGSDNTSIQNEYDPKELETLNKLIASELNASNEYWDANKNTKKPVLSKLYADIGDEERFHTEQLLYAKSQLTGEAYEPHDPEVKKEYEELKALGMDSETAMYTAIDKTSLRSFDDTSEEDTFEDIQESFLSLEYACTTYELYSMIMESNSKVNISRCTSIIMESMIFEAVDTNDKNKHIKLPMNTNPLVMAGHLFVKLLKLIKNLRVKLRRHREKSWKSIQLKRAWIRRHGIKGLFQQGIYLYFYDETRPKLSMINVFYQLIDRVDAALAVICKDFNLGTYNRYPLALNQIGGKHIQFNNTKQAIAALQNIHLTKTKLIVTEENEEALEQKFFGETPDKFKDMNDKNRSNNEYNIFDMGLQTAEDFLEKNVNEVMGRLDKLVQDADSIYYKKEQEFKKLDEAMKVVSDVTNNIIKAVTNDLSEYAKVDNNCLKAATEEKDNPKTDAETKVDSTEDLNTDEPGKEKDVS